MSVCFCIEADVISAATFEADFGHPFACDDGLDNHFKKMMFYADEAKKLASICENNAQKMVEIASQPIEFNIYNPYPEGDDRRACFDAKSAYSPVDSKIKTNYWFCSAGIRASVSRTRCCGGFCTDRREPVPI